MVSVTPTTSSSQGAGMVPNLITGGPANHSQWVDAFVQYEVSKWAWGDTTMPAGWDPQRYGTPDPQDTGGVYSPRTILAFTRYAQDYVPGKDPTIDAAIPWTPPGSNDFVEDPVTTSNRIAQSNFEASLNEQIAQRQAATALGNRNADISQQSNIIQAKTAALAAFNNAFQNELTKYATQAELYTSQQNRIQAGYDTEAGIYKTNETNRSQNLQSAGSLALALQQAYDARTGKAIDLSANPGDFIARESAVRALTAPEGTNVPAYKNVDALQEVINKLINYVPNAAPTRPAETPIAVPTAPTGIPQSTQDMINQLANTQALPSQPQTNTPPAGTSLPFGSDQQQHNTTPTSSTPATPAATPNPNAPGGQTPLQAQLRAILLSGGSLAGYADGGVGVTDRTFIAGDPQIEGVPNQELVQIHNPGPATTASVTPLAQALQGIRKFADGTDPAEGDLMLKSYPDSAYQDYPTLKYIQGRLPANTYNRLSTGSVTGAFGAQIPESGAINYRKFLDIQQDPLSLALLTSSYRSASRDLLSEVARAKARAPLGQSVQTSLIRT